MRTRTRATDLVAGILIALSAAVSSPAGVSPLAAQAGPDGVERNVVYGMVSGAALLMDVYHPAEPNGVDIVWNGHIHSYERTWPLRAGRPTGAGSPPPQEPQP